MASKNQVTIIYMCLELLLFVSFIFTATIFKDNFELTVPSNAKTGHIITKLGCLEDDISIIPEGSPLDEQLFSKLFSIESGNLVVKSDISLYEGTYFLVSAFSNNNCFSNVGNKRTFGIFIKNSKDYMQLEKRIYHGVIPKSSKPGLLVEGLESLVGLINSDAQISCDIHGDSSNLFELVSSGIKLISKLPTESKALYFSLQCTNGKGHGHAGIHITVADDNHGNSLPQFRNSLSQKTNVAVQQDNLIQSFDQQSHRRVRRQAVTRTLSVLEDKTDILTLESPQPGVTTLLWSISLDDTGTFIVNNLGKVSVKPGKKLDYDFGPRNYNIQVQVKSSDGQQVLKTYLVDISVNDVNDEAPQITNHPIPYQAAVETVSSIGTLVYQLSAYDPDTTADVKFYLDAPNDNFDVEPNTGWIKTKKTLSNSNSFVVRAYAQDTAATGAEQKSPIVTVTVYTGNLKPQFNETAYQAKVQETNQADQTFDTLSLDGNISLVYAINFQKKLGGTTTYTVLDGTSISDKFKIDNDGKGVMLTSLNYETDPKTFSLTIQAEDSYSQLKSTVPLTVFLEDKNEFDPTFTLSTYTARVPEDLAIGQSILTVTANDEDLNSVLSFWVSEPLFRVVSLSSNEGQLQVNSTLDYDRQTSHRYEFDIYVKDNGVPSRTSQAKVLIDLTNVNDEKPQFQDDNMVTTIKDNIASGTDVYLVQAVDPDGDKVTYSFENNANVKDIFQINGQTGQITVQGSVPPNIDQYNLKIWATDDGSCCTASRPNQRQESTVTVNIVDAVNTKPSFTDCSSYRPKVLENEAAGTSVFTVSATDNNRGDNGVVEYFAVTDSQTVYFTINQTTGEVTTVMSLDRESFGSRYLFFTVRAVDKGQPPGDDYCTFPITIDDKNDNNPEFGAAQYAGNVLKTAVANTVVMTVKATDKDIGINADVTYTKAVDTEYFNIDTNTGVITVAKTLMSAPDSVVFQVKATDKGVPPRSSTNVIITITIANDDGQNPPDWSTNNPMFNVNETSRQDTLVGSLTATSQIATSSGVSFSAIANGQAGSQVPPFFIQQDQTNLNQVNIYILDSLNFEDVKSYTFQLRARDNIGEVYKDVFPVITVLDQNDEIPNFRGADPLSTYIEASVQENLAPGAAVTTVAAIDEDINPLFKQLKYSLYGAYAQNFSIDQSTGAITTRSSFDREASINHYYLLNVRVDDGYPSARPSANGQPNTDVATVRVKIGDENDNPPNFEKTIYYANVNEDAFISSIVTTVEAKDRDEATFQYNIVPGPGSSFFSIKTQQLVGEIVVAGNLDYENGDKAYNLTIRVNDGKYTAETLVEITINDVNDNPPVFDKPSYVIRNVTEEMVYSPQNPLMLLQAHAMDPDTFREKGMEYRISNEDPVIANLFSIDANTGILNLVGKLDRDKPDGREVYQFNLLAIDEPGETIRLTGYATVQIFPIDINDNKPKFIPDNPTGTVNEMSPVGTSVMRVIAEDYDAGLNAEFTFQIIGDGTPRTAFRIEGDGQVFTTVADLDREKHAQYFFVVQAVDKGTTPQTSSASVTINIIDINDNPPVFNESVYRVTIPETHSGAILTIKADDPDVDEVLRYSLNQDAYKHFTITTQGREGIIGVYNGSNPDYEAGETFFNLTATVKDREDKYTASTNIQITIEDVNDEKPIFIIKNKEINRDEGIATAVDTELATFTATDRDTGLNGEISYFIGKDPRDENPKEYFKLEEYVDPTTSKLSARIRLNKLLDREHIAKHTVYILAMDKGVPSLTGTATLTVSVNDINDEFPKIKGVPYAKIMENAPISTLVTTVLGEDPDLPNNGPPFGFDGIPCTSQSQAQCKFDVNFMAALDGGNGGAQIKSKEVFDREVKKFYYLPIKMWDKRGVSNALSMTGTNTLTIEIGDINDNPHGPGTQNIHVYNYKGMFKNIEIGAVNYADLDDHDIDDKTFVGPDNYQKFFSVNRESGMITMLHNVPTGKWTFNVDVSDRVDKLTTKSSVTVTIEELPEEAPYKSGSVRLSGTTPEEFITPDSEGLSPYDKFRTRLANSLGAEKENVQMISVLKKDDFTDVRFSAHGSPYYSNTKMNGAVLKNRNGFAQDAGATIEMINIDECLKESCESGCYNYLNVTGKANLVNVRGNAIVGVETFVQGKCGCHEPVSQTECDPTYCYNGGTCKKDYWNVLSCECSAGFDGPRCQSTRHGFDGTGYALYKPLEQCENSETSIEFITSSDNGLIMYNGPVSDNFQPQDYMSLELAGGYPILKIDQGSGVQTLSINSNSLNGGSKLSDGKWHHINIRRRGKLITLTVDYCKDIAPTTDGIVDDRSICEITMSTPGENMFLNVNAPLQLGGRQSQPNLPAGITNNKFNGCVRNLRHNNELYDLYTGSGTYPGSFDGCPKEDDACQKNSVNIPKKCGDNGDCQITDLATGATICICNSGWRGDTCDIQTSIKDLQGTGSYMDWTLESTFQSLLSHWDTDVHVMYRTRDTDGVIFHVSSTSTNEFVRLEIVGNHLQVLYNLGDGNHVVSLDRVMASDGQWHKVLIKRRGKFLALAMDNGEGPRYSETQGPDYGHHLMPIKNNQIYAGAALTYTHNTITVSNEKDLNSTCLNDIRLANSWFPMTAGESQQNVKIKLVNEQKVTDNCVRNDCVNAACRLPFVCRPLWEKYECVCPLHYIKQGSTCVPYDYCRIDTPCHPDADCVNDPKNEYGYVCNCHSGWEGRTCYTLMIVDSGSAGVGAWIVAPILVILLILVIAALLWWKCRQTDEGLIEDDEKEDYEVRENVMDYDEEGAGEDDYEGHIQGIGRLPDHSHFDKPVNVNHLGKSAPPPGGPGIGDFIGDRLDDADDDSGAPPYDTMKGFDYEGGGSDAGSLSSLNTSTSGGDQDYDYLNEWGPKFAKLADMYNKYDDSD
ncbi:neural-cadherin-like isoform X3 [Mytilus edulis]|uniref:neural-cadherin-like isoform X3 n=1 Tax=Mytilus edulis TaxID=6550 RepID=UPI0039EF457E